MKCGSKKKVRKFAEGGWSTSVSFDEADAKRRAEEWANKAAAKRAATPKPAPKMEEATVTASRATPKGPSKRFSAKNESKPSRYVPKAFEGVDELKRAGAAVSGAMAEGRKPRTTPMSGPKAGQGWAWLKNKLREPGAWGKYERKYAKGGSVRGDGRASKGKTKGRMC